MKTTLSALAEPDRLHIVELLCNKPLTVGEFADRFGLSQPQASKYLRVLSNAGFVEVHAIANRRSFAIIDIAAQVGYTNANYFLLK